MSAVALTEAEPVITPEQTGSEWGLMKRVAFRFAFVYLILFNLPIPLGILPWTGTLATKYGNLWHPVVAWVASHVFRITSAVSVAETGSGDRTYDWILLSVFLTMSITAALVWSLLDRKRTDYKKLDQWLRLYIRLALACWMMTYGGYKIVPAQFPPPLLMRLIQPYGESTPMGLLWTFMGASPSYTIFTGCVEMIAGVLLVFPRTAVAGATLSLAAMAQVFLLNICYDVPVKLLSFHLILMSLFLLLPHLRRIANLFLFNRTAEAYEMPPLLKRKWPGRALLIGQIVFGAIVFVSCISEGYAGYKLRVKDRVPLHGIWNVEEIAVNGELRPPLLTDQNRWRRAVFQFPAMMIVQTMDGPRRAFQLNLDMEGKKMTLAATDNPESKAEFSFDQAESNVLTLDGQLEGRPTKVKLVRMDESQFELVSHGFHWISERPNGR